MRDMNLWTIMGNLTKAPQLNHLTDGTAVCHFRLAVSSRKHPEAPAFVDVTAWRRDAEHCAAYLKKGSRVCVAGPLRAALVMLEDGRPILDLAVDAKYLEFMGGPRPKDAEQPADQELSPKGAVPGGAAGAETPEATVPVASAAAGKPARR